MKKLLNVIVSIVNLFLLICLVWAFYKQPDAHFSGKNITDLLAIVISCISIVITILFVVLAVNAYGRINEIEKNAENAAESAGNAKASSENANILVQEIKNTSDSAILSLRRIGDANKSFYDSTLEFIDMISRSNTNKKTKERNQRWRREIERNLYRLGLHPYYLDDNVRESFILNLSIFGDKTDIEPLQKIIESENESEKIKKAAKTVLDVLKNKFP